MSNPTSYGRDDLLDQIKERIPLERYVEEQAGVKLRPAKSGREMVGLCLFHEDSHPSMSISVEKGVFQCLACGAAGNIVHVHAHLKGMDYGTAIKDLAKDLGIQREEKMAWPLKLLNDTAFRYHQGLQRSKVAMDYLTTKRGLKPETIVKFGIGYCYGDEFGKAGEKVIEGAVNAGILKVKDAGGNSRAPWAYMSRRVTFPIKDRDGKVVALGGRTLNEDEKPKYLNTPETEWFKKSDLLYGFSDAKSAIREAGYAVVVEGYMDVVMLSQNGIENVAGVMGASASEKAFEPVWRITNKLVFCLDGDKAGRDGTMRSIRAAAPSMKDGCEIQVLALPEGLDPDEYVTKYGAEAFRTLCKKATPLSMYIFQENRFKFNLDLPEGRAGFLSEIEQFSNSFKSAPLLSEQIYLEAKAAIFAHVANAALKSYAIAPSAEELESALMMARMRAVKTSTPQARPVDKPQQEQEESEPGNASHKRRYP